MIKLGDKFVSVYDGYAMEFRVIGIKGTKVTLSDDICQETVIKIIRNVTPGKKQYFYHNSHCYRHFPSFDTQENNRIKI